MPTKRFEKGKPRHPKAGRKKGTPNKFTTLKQAFLDAFQDDKIGGTKGLITVFSKNDIRKIEFFKLVSKMLPSNVSIDGKLNVTFQASEKYMPKIRNEKKKDSPGGAGK